MAVIDRHSPIAHPVYHDLLRSLREETVSDLRGTPAPVERNRRVYWYDSFRIGSDVKKTYLGEDSPELRERIARAADISAKSDASTERG